MHFKEKAIIQRLKLEKKNSIIVQIGRIKKAYGKDYLKTADKLTKSNSVFIENKPGFRLPLLTN